MRVEISLYASKLKNVAGFGMWCGLTLIERAVKAYSVLIALLLFRLVAVVVGKGEERAIPTPF